jgi:hypothetical protein
MKQRDIELLSSYLDGQLSSSDATRLEARLLVEPDLRSVLRDLRSTRSVLRQLPMRKAPRNFKLTPKMVGKNPPLPRAYPVFRFTSVLATIMLFLSFGLNMFRTQMASPIPGGFGMGGGGGGAPEETFSVESAPAAATEAPAAEEPSVAMAPMPTQTIAGQADTARAMETPATKTGDAANGVGGGLEQSQPAQVPQEPPPAVSPVWQWLLTGVALLSAFMMALMRQLSINRWRRKN